jgi:integrase
MKITQPRDGEPIRLVILPSGEPRYRVVLDGGPHPVTGKRRQLTSTWRTISEARAHVDQARADLRRGVFVTPDRQTFEEYAAGWLETRARRVRPVTLAAYRSCVHRANDVFGAKPLGKVSRVDVERLVAVLADAGRSKRTAGLVLFVVRSIFADALQDGLIVRNPAGRVEAAGWEPRARTALSGAELGKLRAHLSADPLYGCWLLTLHGLRRSELLGLRWSDVDLGAGTLTVERGVTADTRGGRNEETPTKTRRGTRTLPLPPDVLTVLRGLRDRQAAELGLGQVRTGWLAVDELGVPYRPERWSDMWRDHCAAAGVPVVTLHVARHSSVTAMRDAGVADHVVAAWHGHDEGVMRRTYSHPDADALAKAGRTLDSVIGGKAAPMA